MTIQLAGTKAVVTGGSRGLGLGIVEALVARKAQVTVVARNPERLEAVKRRLGVAVIAGDITDRTLAHDLLRELRPTLLVLNAGGAAPAAPIEDQTWEGFSAAWNTDVKGGLFWIQEALELPLPPGARVLLGSSGAALRGPPTSGGYAGAKRMLWMMASHANHSSAQKKLGLHFQVVVPMQVMPDTDFGRNVAEAHARAAGKTVAEYMAHAFGAPFTPAQYGELIATSLTDARFDQAPALGFKGDTGISVLDP